MNGCYTLKDLYKDSVVKRPYSPSHWEGKPTHQPITMLRMTCGGGMGGAQWFEYVEPISPTDLSQPFITCTRAIDKTKITLNTKYIVTMENFVLASCMLVNDGNQYFRTDRYFVRLSLGNTVSFVDAI